MDGIPQGTCYGTDAWQIECSTNENAYDNSDSLMARFWCRSVDVHYYRTNWDTALDLYGKMLGRTYGYKDWFQIGAYVVIEVVLS